MELPKLINILKRKKFFEMIYHLFPNSRDPWRRERTIGRSDDIGMGESYGATLVALWETIAPPRKLSARFRSAAAPVSRG